MLTGNELNRYTPTDSTPVELVDDVLATVDDMFEYHKWDDKKIEAGGQVRAILAEAVKTILAVVPPSADRSAAIRKIREARMDCNSAITHDGKF